MATSVDVEWVRSVIEVGGETKYQLVTTCSSPSVGFHKELFLFEDKVPDPDLYLHVCTIGDVLHYGTTPGGADTKYRKDTVTQVFDSPEDSDDEEELQKTRLQNLVNDWEAGYGTWPGTTSETISNT